VSNILILHTKIFHSLASPFWFASGCTFWSPLFHSMFLNNSYTDDVTQTTIYDTNTILLILGASIFSFFGQVFASRSFQLEKAARCSAVSYIQVITAFLWYVLYFKTDLKWNHIVGSILIIGVIFIMTILKAFGVIKD
jgi:drug/metabolite transporter (DMT)-like permease